MSTIEVYGDANYQGKSQTFGVGKYDVKDLNVVGNDAISSIKVHGDVEVVAYEDGGFQGASIIVRGDANGLADWNDRISSLEVRPVTVSGAADKVVVYSDACFHGRSQELAVGEYDTKDLTVGNDAISSIRIPKGLRVVVYEDSGFKGHSLELTAGEHVDMSAFGWDIHLGNSMGAYATRPDVVFGGTHRTWNDQISSIRVCRA